ncbi:APC family permease [Lactobacillus acidophilus]|uniref:APC family permease n=2 Tax=Lactobacillus acidophilus TaxID=1579 RepID=UPI000354F24C|nr:amino acid permease [Lactobacillus acidophilus]AVW86870.1 serine/threonine protein kinase [Lactobacillus acidophilus]KHE29841.1 serine/threonine protein kinase [Lactobacillus acidophilus]KRK29081.1 amino acid permease [Lactobacillus acidophilus DSM 20079 = JCM 1132 = NBRC 13951 = CIP 76.13]MBA4557308.1 amino acid permease [Lactobacillus acidophilus]MBN3465664.1 amino acid permease [Lactobacillus acidophilus]
MGKENNELKRSLGFGSAISIVIGTIIGSGIFFKQASILDSAGSSSMAISAWIFGGVITLAAGLTIAEIGAQMPYTGGLYVYVENLYGRICGFLAGWMQVIVYGPAIIASVAGFMSIMITNLFGIDAKWRIPIALIIIIAIGLMNFLENKVAAAFSVITTIGKMIPIAAIIIFGLFWGHQDALGQTVSEINRSAGGFGVAVLATLFGYDGWILIANLGGEMKNPQKLLPKAIILGISTVLVIYTLITVGIFRFVPANMIHSLGENTTSYLATRAFGDIGGKLLSIGIIVSMMGTLNGKIITFPRIVYAMARRGDLPFSRILSYVTPKGKSPVVATIFIILLATIMMLFFDPDHLSDLCVFTIYCFYLLTFFGIFILRKKNSKRPFSTPLYPFVPIVAIAGGIFVLVSELFNDPAGVLLFAGIVIIGLPVLYVVKKMDKND